MDPITHAALGAACSQTILGKYSKHIPWQIGALAAMAPDLDIFIHFKNDPMSGEVWHRYFTHSLLFMPLGGLLVGLFFICFPYYRKLWKVTLAAALIGYATHALLDALTSYGTVLLWPWSDARISWDIVAIIDPMVTIPLVIGTAWSVIHQERKGVILGLFWVIALLVFNAVQHHRALQSMRDFGKKQGWQLTQIRAMPELASSTHWRLIGRNNHCLVIAEVHTPIIQSNSLKQIAQLPLWTQQAPSGFTPGQQRDLGIFSWFSDGYVVLAQKEPLILADGRYTFGDGPLYSLWGITFPEQHSHIKKVKQTLLKEPCFSNAN